MSVGGAVPRRALDRRGRSLAALSVTVMVVLFLCAFVVIAYGAWIWRTVPNPDPMGFASGLFFTATMILLLVSFASVFVLFSFVGEYRLAWKDSERGEIARRWTGTLFLLAGVPFFRMSLVLFGPVGQVLWMGALLAFATGAGFHIHAYVRSGTGA